MFKGVYDNNNICIYIHTYAALFAFKNKKTRKARKHLKWVIIMGVTGMQYNFKICIGLRLHT